MRIPGIYNLIPLMFLLVVNTAASDTRAVVEIEVIKGEDIKKSSQIITYGENRVRIDFSGEQAKVTRETPYIMTVDGGETWVLGDKPKDKFYCSKMQTEEFFKNVGNQVTSAMEFFNVTAVHPTVKKILEEPGPKIKAMRPCTCSWRPMPQHTHGSYFLKSIIRSGWSTTYGMQKISICTR